MPARTNFKCPSKKELARHLRSMEIYHAILGNTDTQALQLFPDHSRNLLISAAVMAQDQRWRKKIPLIHKKAKSLFCDSGMIGWVRNEGKKAIRYAKNPDVVLDLQLEINPHIIAHTDIICDSFCLSPLGMSIQEAIKQTVSNADWLVEKRYKDPRLKGKTIALAIQGHTIDDYLHCLDEYRKRHFCDTLPPDYFIFAIGSVAMRTPPDLYEIAQAIRVRLPDKYRLHCYGIAYIPWMLQLEHLGITSCDSATANLCSKVSRFIDSDGKQTSLRQRYQDSTMKAGLFAYNMASIEYQLREKRHPVMEELFYDHSEQLEFM